MGYLRLKTVSGFMALAFLLMNGCPIVEGPADPPEQSDASAQSTTESDGNVRKIYDRINAFRTSQGLKRLQLDPFLSKIAAEHSRNMAGGKVDFGHQGFEQRATAIQTKVKFRSMAENVGESAGKADPIDEVVKGWLKSPGHLQNIKGDFDLTGIGVAKKIDNYFFTQIFLKKFE